MLKRLVWARLMIVLALIALPPSFEAQEADTAALRQTFAEATAAYRDKAFDTYLSKMESLAAKRPTHPTILYRLAGAFALTQRPADVARVLNRLADLSLTYDVGSDPDFAAVRTDERVAAAARRLAEVGTKRIGASQTAWTIADRTFIPEGIAYDAETHSFFVSSQYQRRIVRVDGSGKVTPFVREAQDGLFMAFGIAVDPRRRLLWAVSTADPLMKGFTPADEGRAGVFAFRLSDGTLARRVAAEPSTPAPYFDDLTVRSDGRVFLSEGGRGAIYSIPPDSDRVELFVAPGSIQGPNGLALAADEQALYVADYAGFICRVDLASRAVSRLPQPPDTTLYGIDGLVFHHGGLIGIQNGTTPPRIIRLTLTDDGRALAAVRIVEMNHPLIGEPTLGVVVDDTLYFVADSSGTAFRKAKGDLSAATLTVPPILKLKLD
jgi:sugar lactone lactonase YvrE